MLPISSIRNHSDRPGTQWLCSRFLGQVADRVEAPRRGFPREADRFERDRDLGGPALRARRARRQPVGVPGDVPRTPVVRPALVLLGSQRVDHEHVGVVVVVERVEDERHGVVLPDLAVALGDRPGDGVRIRVAALDPEIDHSLVVEDPNDRALGGRRAGDRLELGEGLDGGGAAPVRLVQHAVDLDGSRRPCCRNFLGCQSGTPRDERDWSEEYRHAIAHRPWSVPRAPVGDAEPHPRRFRAPARCRPEGSWLSEGTACEARRSGLPQVIAWRPASPCAGAAGVSVRTGSRRPR